MAESGDPHWVIETARLGIREFVPGDAAFVSAVFADPAARRFYPDMHRPEQGESWVRRNLERYGIDGFGLWLIVLRETGEAAGDCGLMRQPVEGREEIEVGYHLHAAFRGRGIATEAAAACMRWGFDHLDIDRIISLVHPDNAASRAVAGRLHRHLRPVVRRGEDYLMFFTERND